MGILKCDKCGEDRFKRVFVSSPGDVHRGHYEDLCVGCYEDLKKSGVTFEDFIPVPEHKELCCGREMVMQWRVGRNKDGAHYVEMTFYECGVCGLWVITEEVKNWNEKQSDRRVSFKRRVVDFRDTSKQLQFDVLSGGDSSVVLNRVYVDIEKTDKNHLVGDFEDFAENIHDYLAELFDDLYACILRHKDKED